MNVTRGFYPVRNKRHAARADRTEPRAIPSVTHSAPDSQVNRTGGRMLINILLFLGLMGVACSTPVEESTLQSGPLCHDWGEWAAGPVRVYEGEAGRLFCPLFSPPTIYNYSQIQSAGLTLLWYRHTNDTEEPIDLRQLTLLKHKDALWIQPATQRDSGLYICMLRNISSCVRIAVQLEVVPRKGKCDGFLHRNITVPIESRYVLLCPDLQHLPSGPHNVTWYHNCMSSLFWNFRKVVGDQLEIRTMFEPYAGPYTCAVSYRSNGRTLEFTRTINIRAVAPTRGSKHPRILNPTSGQIYSVTQGEDAVLLCRVHLPHLPDEEQQVWWSINNKTVEELQDTRYKSPPFRVEEDQFGDKTVQRELHVSKFTAEDLQKEFRCSAQNGREFNSSIATLQEEVYIPSVELGCGLGVTLVLALLLFVMYRVFRLEVHLLYRSWFGTDERYTDDKEYDVYISYARNGEEEEFVMETLRRVLEVELGYTVCIFDRDSLPGGNLLESVLKCMQASRRLLVVLSTECVCEKSVSLLECRLCVYLHHTSHTPLITVRRRALGPTCSELTELRKHSTCIHWHGARSQSTSSRFWKLLRLALPLRPLALGPRLIDSTSSHSDLASAALRHTHSLAHKRRDAGPEGETESGRLRGRRGNGGRRRGCVMRGRGCVQSGRGCAVCVSFQENHRIWGGVSVPQWSTHLQQMTVNGTLIHTVQTTHTSTDQPVDKDGNDETGANHCPCEQTNNSSTCQTTELQTTHC